MSERDSSQKCDDGVGRSTRSPAGECLSPCDLPYHLPLIDLGPLTAYHCGRAADRICPNTTRVPEAWLREAVLGLVRDRLLPTGGSPWTATRLGEVDWFAPLLAQIQSERDRQAGDRTDRCPALASAIARLEQQIAGWKLCRGTRASIPRSAARWRPTWGPPSAGSGR